MSTLAVSFSNAFRTRRWSMESFVHTLVGQLAELPFVERSLRTAPVDVGKLSDRQRQLSIIEPKSRCHSQPSSSGANQ
ncbi:hypothetical protein [Sphingomonas sp. Leaf22]|uniref:hypothetical protein n=1 Tax=Sphingomonas sp. Leaf22 TaxID=1735687 RepID=UPI0012E18A20|nr:hypothetical protein [Sphingomonas sp. Leaf22]